MKRLKLLLIAMVAVVGVKAADTDLLNDIVDGRFKPKTLARMTPMSDGEHYAQQVGNDVFSYSYKTGQVADTLFSFSGLNLEKSLKLDDIEGFSLLESERYMLLYRNRKQIFRRSFEADYYIYDRQKRIIKALSDTMPVREPIGSPNGKYIAFTRNGNLYIHKLDFGTEVAVTYDTTQTILNGATDWLYEEEFGTTGIYSFSPDSKQLAFLRTNISQVPQYHWQTVLTDGMPQDEYVRYSRAGEENPQVKAMVYDIQYKSVKQMQVEAEYIPRIRWTNSSEQLAVFTLNRNQQLLEMWLCNPKSTIAKRSYREENKNGWVNYDAIDEWQFIGEDQMLVVSEKSGYRHAYMYSILGQEQEQLTTGEYDVTTVYGVSATNNTLFYQAATVDGEKSSPMNRTIWAYNIKKKKTQPLLQNEGFHIAQFSKDLSYFVDDYSSLTTPNRYTLYDSQAKRVRELLNNDELQKEFESLQLPTKSFFTFHTAHGDDLNGWMIAPKSNKKMPALLIQYSGPESQQVLNRWRIDWEYFLASKGVACVSVDGRGTGARGRDFRQQTYMQMGQKEAEDQVAVANYLKTRDNIDPSRIGIWGWSFGGFMTILSMSHQDSPFRCGIAVAPVTDFRLYDSAYTERFMRTPQMNEDGYEQIALPKMADKLKGRLLIVHGLADDNVHAQNLWQYTDALVKAGKQFDMQVYPDDNHFLRKRSNYKHLYNRKWLFLQEQLMK